MHEIPSVLSDFLVTSVLGLHCTYCCKYFAVDSLCVLSLQLGCEVLEILMLVK